MFIVEAARVVEPMIPGVETPKVVVRTGERQPVSSYCASCGSWEAHGLTCSSCGYDFAEQTALKDAEP